jgi:hypothetical protein
MAKGISVELPHRGEVVAPVSISAPGFSREIVWAPVPGATGVELAEASLSVRAAEAREVFPDVAVISSGNHRDVTVPEGRSVRAIGLDAVPSPDQRLVLSLPSVRGGFEAPIYASKDIDNGDMAPSSPERAPLSNGLFQLPRSVTASKLRLSMATGNKVVDFKPVPFALSRVNLQTATAPRNLRVTGPDGAVLWQAPSLPIDSAAAEVDLKVPLEIAFKKSLTNPRAVVTVAGDEPSLAYVRFSGVHGALLRVEDGIRKLSIKGAPTPLALASPLAPEQPATAIGDLTITYEGLRILETVSDTVPAMTRFAEGPIVGPGASPLHVFPPEALAGINPARIGILGRAPEDCEIALEFVPVVGNTVGPAIGPPAVLTLGASNRIALHWAEIPSGLVLGKSLALRARANRGHFLWMAIEARPVVRMAIVDPDPGGRPLRVSNVDLSAVAAAKTHLTKFAFPAALFRNGFPSFASDLFLTVEISDLTLRYAR